MVLLALILMAGSALVIDYFKVRSERKTNNTQTFEATTLNHVHA
jgi:hypothetical protein